jgi:hypothetical protein
MEKLTFQRLLVPQCYPTVRNIPLMICMLDFAICRCGPGRRAGASGHPAGDEGGGDVRRGAEQHFADGRTVGAKRVCLHRAAGELSARGQDGGRLQLTHDFLRESFISILFFILPFSLGLHLFVIFHII